MFRRTLLQTARVGRRQLSGQAYKTTSSRLGVGLGGAVVAGAGLLAWDRFHGPIIPTLKAATVPKPQPNVASQGKNHALYLWIHLSPGADAKKVAKAVAGLDGLVKKLCPADLTDEEDEVGELLDKKRLWDVEILAGVGFGPEYYQKLGKTAPAKYAYPHRGGAVGDLPSTGGDIFVHAKSNTMSKLYELAAEVKAVLPSGSVASFEDTYSFVYRNGRDLSGFIDGTENRADDEGRHEITQKWIHQHCVIRGEKRPGFGSPKPVEIVRQSMPFGTVGGESGLFFIGFAAKPDNFEYMLKRMVGEESDGVCDDVMRLSKCTQGTYWYFPSPDELKTL